MDLGYQLDNPRLAAAVFQVVNTVAEVVAVGVEEALVVVVLGISIRTAHCIRTDDEDHYERHRNQRSWKSAQNQNKTQRW